MLFVCTLAFLERLRLIVTCACRVISALIVDSQDLVSDKFENHQGRDVAHQRKTFMETFNAFLRFICNKRMHA